MRKTYFIILGTAFVVGLLNGIMMLQSVQTKFSIVVLFLFGLTYMFSMVYLSLRFDRIGLMKYSYPLVALVMYIPVNILAGLNVESQTSNWYFYSFPRYDIIPYYVLALLLLYAAARLVDSLLKQKHSNTLFLITDIISLAALPFLFLATYFVSPA